MSHHPVFPPQSSQTYELLNSVHGGLDSNNLLNAPEKLTTPNPPLSQVHPHSHPELGSPPQGIKQEEWKSWKLKTTWMLIIFSFEIGLLVSIIYLQRRSSIHNGIVTVHPDTASFISFSHIFSRISHYSLLWTTTPTLVIRIYSFMWTTIVEATANRQPFVDLNYPLSEAKSAKTTIFLDYRTYSSFNNWLEAFRNGHIGFCIAMLLSIILSFAIGPLTASLFISAASQSQFTVSVNRINAFNDSIFDPTTNLQSFIDFASSTRSYHAQPPSWMTENYSFTAFEPLKSTTSFGNLTANTTAYSAQLDCKAFSPEESNAQYSVDSSGNSAVTYSINDRGCSISSYQALVNTTTKYSVSWYQGPKFCPGTPYSRLGIFAGFYTDSSPYKIANYTLISCIPRYFLTTGLLTVPQGVQGSNIISFNQTKSTEVHPFWISTLEAYLHNYLIFDPSNTYMADAFGKAVLQYAQSQNGVSPITPTLYNSSIAELYSSLFVYFAHSALLQDIISPVTEVGEISTSVQRLYVVDAVAWAVVAVLFCALICNIYLWLYAAKKV